MPTAWVMDAAREPMIAVKMNDEPLPPIHGYPARLIIPGLYGYVSATKWLSRAGADDARGVRRLLGAARLGQGGADPDPVADRHAARLRVGAGGSPIAGVAWAPDRGISKVEVGIDGDVVRGGPVDARSPTRPGSSGSPTGTRRPAGTSCRSAPPTATASLQEELPSPPAPDGARGWHTVGVEVA